GQSAHSTLYAVYDAFHKYAGVNWVYPGEAASIAEQSSAESSRITQSVKSGHEAKLYEPWFERRGFVFETINEPVYISNMIDWMTKNRINEIFFTFTLWDLLKDVVAPEIVKRGISVTLGGHSMKFFLNK